MPPRRRQPMPPPAMQPALPPEDDVVSPAPPMTPPAPEAGPAAETAQAAAPVSPQPVAVEIAPAQPGAPVGEQLMRARVARGEQIGTIAQYLRIKPEYLFAFEQGRHEQLPALTYALGFLRSYADYLGLDGAALRNAFRQEMMGRLTPQLMMPQPLPEAKTPPWPIIAGALALAGLIYGGWQLTGGGERAQPAAPPPLMASQLDIGPPGSPPLIPTPEPLPEPAKVEQHFGELEKPTRRTIRAEGEVWITVTDGKDKVVFSQMLNPGDTYHVPDVPGLKLTSANAASLEITVDGKAAPKLGKQGQVVRDVALDKLK